MRTLFAIASTLWLVFTGGLRDEFDRICAEAA